jgi:hypothetical protein
MGELRLGTTGAMSDKKERIGQRRALLCIPRGIESPARYEIPPVRANLTAEQREFKQVALQRITIQIP